MTDIKKTPLEMIEEIKTVSSLVNTTIQTETERLVVIIQGNIQKLLDISNDYRKNVELSKLEWQRIKNEILILEEKRGSLKVQLEEFDAKIAKVNAQEAELLVLHKVLDNRRQMLDAREVQIKEKERRAR